MTPSQLKFYRTGHGLRQHDLAERIGVTQGRISALENGARPSAAETERLQRALGLPSGNKKESR